MDDEQPKGNPTSIGIAVVKLRQARTHLEAGRIVLESIDAETLDRGDVILLGRARQSVTTAIESVAKVLEMNTPIMLGKAA